MVELVRHERPTRVIDEVVAAAGASSLGPGLRPSGDGSALARLRLIDGERAELRVAPTGHPKDPMHGREALIALEAAGLSHVPRPLACGRTSGAVWTTETVLRGRRALRLTQDLIADVADLCVRLPAAPTPPRAIRDQLADVTRVFPTLTGRLRAVASAAEAWAGDMPAVLLHGDLWLNNLLVRDGRLSGLFDWETWHPAGLPGTDLLNLLAADERSRSGRDVGELLVAGYWRSEAVLDVLRGYFASRGLPFPGSDGLAAIAVGWWASRVAGALDRGGRPTADPVWVRTNLDEPLAWLAERIDAGRG
jgi:aminoglycoside phosphotransferase (APT) family kinase protein